jgi:hypothetical protein
MEFAGKGLVSISIVSKEKNSLLSSSKFLDGTKIQNG